MPELAIGGFDIVALIIALAVLLVLGAMWVLAKPIELVLGQVPVIGGYMGHAFTDGLESAMGWVVGAYDKLIHATAHLFWALGVGVWHLVYQFVKTELHLADQLGSVVTRLGQLFAQAIAKAVAEGAAAISVAEALYNQAVAFAAGRIAWLLSVVQSYYNQAVHHADVLYGDALGAVSSAEAVLRGVVAADVATLGVEIATASDRVYSEAVRLFGEAEAAAGAAVAGVEATVAGIEGQITGLEGQVGNIVGALGVLAVIPGLATAVQALTTEADTCLKPLCDTVTPNAGQLGKLGTFLSGLESLAIDGLVAGLFVEAVTNPAGLAHDTVTLLETLGDPVIAGVRDLAGL